jgi:very-short-patch-repair endonuclease
VGVTERAPAAIHTSERSDRLARRLRRDPTFAERQLWKALRQLDGFHFRRQAPLGDFVVDFVSHRARLVVEVDGGVHALDVVAQRDAEREAWLRGRGYDVVRVSNALVVDHVEQALALIIAAVGARTPTPGPSPQGGGERTSG